MIDKSGLTLNGWAVQVPADLRDYLKLLLSLTPDLRPTPEQVNAQNGWKLSDKFLESGAAASLL